MFSMQLTGISFPHWWLWHKQTNKKASGKKKKKGTEKPCQNSSFVSAVWFPSSDALVSPVNKHHVYASKTQGFGPALQPGTKQDQKLEEAQKVHAGSGKTLAEASPHWAGLFPSCLK